MLLTSQIVVTVQIYSQEQEDTQRWTSIRHQIGPRYLTGKGKRKNDLQQEENKEDRINEETTESNQFQLKKSNKVRGRVFRLLTERSFGF